MTNRTRSYLHDPAVASYGLEAAEALGVAPERVFKTLLVDTGDGLAVAVVPVDRQLDLKAVAAALGVKRASMADPREAERAWGYLVGGISPAGQRRELPTLVDESVVAHGTVFASGGRRGLDLELSPTDLIRVTAARTAAITR